MKVSVIIPVYNKESFVRRCLTQALSQDFEDYEVIAVDDGSTDHSGNICDEVAKGDNRLRVIHTQNGGVTAARCRGLQEARGEYVMFCDSDDELLPCALRNSYEAAQINRADEVIAPYRNQRGDLFDSGRRGVVAATDVIKDFLSNKNTFPPNCAVLFRRRLLEGCLDIPREIVMGEDILFHISYLTKITSVFCLDTCNYVYNQGISPTFKSTLAYEQLYDALLRKVLANLWDELEPWYVLRQLKCYERFIDQRDFYVRKSYYHNLRLNSSIPLTDRIAYWLPPRLSYYLISYYKRWLSRKSRRITDYCQ